MSFLRKIFKVGDSSPHNVDWEKIRVLQEYNEYLKLLDYMVSVEDKTPQINEQKQWRELKDVIIKGAFIEKFYHPAGSLLSEKKYSEAKKMANAGLDFIDKNFDFFVAGDLSFKTMSEELKELEDETGNLNAGFLLAYHDDIRKKLGGMEGLAKVYFDLFVTPFLCDRALSNKEEEKGTDP